MVEALTIWVIGLLAVIESPSKTVTAAPSYHLPVNENHINLHDIVEFVEPYDDEVGTTYRVIELKGDRCVIEMVCDMRIRPTWTRLVADLKRVETT